MAIEALPYVNDIIDMGSKVNIEKVRGNLVKMAKSKKYTFNNGSRKIYNIAIKIETEKKKVSTLRGREE